LPQAACPGPPLNVGVRFTPGAVSCDRLAPDPWQYEVQAAVSWLYVGVAPSLRANVPASAGNETTAGGAWSTWPGLSKAVGTSWHSLQATGALSLCRASRCSRCAPTVCRPGSDCPSTSIGGAGLFPLPWHPTQLPTGAARFSSPLTWS